MLSRLIFSSHAPTIERVHIDTILSSACQGNARCDITGAMCYQDATFLQYMEGNADALDTMFEHIRSDARHMRVALIEHKGIWSRIYPGHAMRMLAWTFQSRATLGALHPRPASGLGALPGATAATLFRALAPLDSWEKE